MQSIRYVGRRYGRFDIDTTTAALLGSATGAVGALLGSFTAGVFTTRNETRRQADARQLAYAQKVRDHVGRALQALFVFHHSMLWLTWQAKYNSGGLGKSHITSYDSEIHDAGPRLMSEVAAIASANVDIWEGCIEAVNLVLDFEEQISLQVYRLSSRSRKHAIYELAVLHEQLRPVMRDAVTTITNLMRDAEQLTPTANVARSAK